MRELASRVSALAAAGLLVLAACGEQGGGDADDDSDAGPSTELTITVQADEDAEPQEMSLECDPVGGDHPNAEVACQRLAEAGAEVFRPVPEDQPCTMIDGGPQTATIVGVLDGEQVDASFNRSGGCEIARWDALEEVFDVRLQ